MAPSPEASAASSSEEKAAPLPSSPSSPSWPDPDSLRNADEIKSAFRHLSAQEAEVDAELEELLSRQSGLEARLRQLSASASAPRIRTGAVQSEARKLGSVISFTAGLAEGVSAKVRQLDLAKVRIVSSMPIL